MRGMIKTVYLKFSERAVVGKRWVNEIFTSQHFTGPFFISLVLYQEKIPLVLLTRELKKNFWAVTLLTY